MKLFLVICTRPNPAAIKQQFRIMVALPDGMEEVAPSFTHHGGDELPQWTDAGVTGQLIAGSAYGLTAGAQTHSSLFYAHLEMAPGATAEFPAEYKERALYVAAGAVEMDGARHDTGRMLVLAASGAGISGEASHAGRGRHSSRT